jgi:hypothetical protein
VRMLILDRVLLAGHLVGKALGPEPPSGPGLASELAASLATWLRTTSIPRSLDSSAMLPEERSPPLAKEVSKRHMAEAPLPVQWGPPLAKEGKSAHGRASLTLLPGGPPLVKEAKSAVAVPRARWVS